MISLHTIAWRAALPRMRHFTLGLPAAHADERQYTRSAEAEPPPPSAPPVGLGPAIGSMARTAIVTTTR